MFAPSLWFTLIHMRHQWRKLITEVLLFIQIWAFEEKVVLRNSEIETRDGLKLYKRGFVVLPRLFCDFSPKNINVQVI